MGLKAAGSTVIASGVLPVTVGGYMFWTFFQTVLLVLCLGLLHGLFLLPVFLSRLPRLA